MYWSFCTGMAIKVLVGSVFSYALLASVVMVCGEEAIV